MEQIQPDHSLLFLLIVNLISASLIFLVVLLLKSKGKRNYIQTYSNSRTKVENGPILKLPRGVVCSVEDPEVVSKPKKLG